MQSFVRYNLRYVGLKEILRSGSTRVLSLRYSVGNEKKQLKKTSQWALSYTVFSETLSNGFEYNIVGKK